MFDLPFEMRVVYLGSAIVGGAVLVIQLIATLAGGDGDLDADADLAEVDGGSGLSIRTATAFLTFFGIAGMACTQSEVGPWATLGIAVLCGSLAFWLVGLGMMQLARLRSSGNVDIQNAVGVEAKVYLAVPAERSGTGTVTVAIQGRTMQYRAITKGAEIATGKFCRVIAVHGSDTLEVERN